MQELSNNDKQMLDAIVQEERKKVLFQMSLDQKRAYLESLENHQGYWVLQDYLQKEIESIKLNCEKVSVDEFTAFKNRLIGMEEAKNYLKKVMKKWEPKPEPKLREY